MDRGRRIFLLCALLHLRAAVGWAGSGLGVQRFTFTHSKGSVFRQLLSGPAVTRMEKKRHTQQETP